MITYLIFYTFTLGAGLLVRRKVTTWIFLFIVFLFIGLRKDTGFDWIVYQDVFEGLAEDFSSESLAYFIVLYRQELGFLFFTGVLGQLIPNYEFYQATITLLLIWSTVMFSRSVGVTKVPMVIALIMSYLLWSVAFSTLRQSLAISIFNFGLAFFLSGKKYRGAGFFAIAPFLHTSAIIYITTYIAAWFLYRKQRPPKIRSFALAVLASSLSGPFLIQIASSISSSVALRVQWYQSFEFSIGMLEIVFPLFFLFCALIASKKMTRMSEVDEAGIKLRQILLVMAAIGASSVVFPIVRDRVSYEVFILASICVMMPGMRYRRYFIGGLASFGIFISSINIFPSPNNLVFIPYQNVITQALTGSESTGGARMQEFMSRFDENMFD